jgi:hypothetical protein
MNNIAFCQKSRNHFELRTFRWQYLARHLHECGPRSVLEALLAVEAGTSLDAVSADFGRLPSTTYHLLPIDAITVFDGGLAS